LRPTVGGTNGPRGALKIDANVMPETVAANAERGALEFLCSKPLRMKALVPAPGSPEAVSVPIPRSRKSLWTLTFVGRPSWRGLAIMTSAAGPTGRTAGFRPACRGTSCRQG